MSETKVRSGSHADGRRASVSGSASMLGVLLLAAACGADADEADRSGPVVQDSAGVTIVSNSGDGRWGSDGWTLSESLRIGPEDADPEWPFERIGGIDADEMGRIVVIDMGAHRAHTFAPSGEPIASFGRVGEGPGEFPNMFLLAAPGGVVVDSVGQIQVPLGDGRVKVFSWDGELVNEYRTPPGEGTVTGVSGWARTEEGVVFEEVNTMTLDRDGRPAGLTAAVVRRGEDGAEGMVVLPPRKQPEMSSSGVMQFEAFTPVPVWTITRDGEVAVAVPDDYSVRVYDGEGELARILRRSTEGEVVTEGDRDAFRGAARAIFEEGGLPEAFVDQTVSAIIFPERWPLLGRILGGPDGTLWVQRIDRSHALENPNWTQAFMGGLPGPTWDVFDRDGAFMGEVRMPAGFTPFRFRGQHLYGVAEDSLGVQQVLRLTLDQ